jgi:hypothetical protein
MNAEQAVFGLRDPDYLPFRLARLDRGAKTVENLGNKGK